MKLLKLLFVIILLNIIIPLESQNYTNFSFKYYDSISVQKYTNFLIKFPWLGGFNAMQVCNIDLDLDGELDLVFFDRIGNKLLPFINNNDKNSIYNLEFSPQYISSFPIVKNWIICKDYDNDGLIDIFTYTVGGIKVYKNISTDDSLQFKQVTFPFIRSYYNNVYTNILATSVDYPGIVDIDDDGDLDILVFGALGEFIEFHHNYSMEKYGIPDSLLFYKESDCWGYFAEGNESNEIILNTCLGGKNYDDNYYSVSSDNLLHNDRHTGSTFLLFDANKDNIIDLLLGDVDYSTSCILYNKDKDKALIYDYSFEYPYKDNINLFSFPVSMLVDVDNDGINELLVSTFDPDVTKSDGLNCFWLYENIGNNENPDFVLSTKQFLQEQMIDVGTGSFPLLFDYDNDGLLDLFIGNYGYCDSCYYVMGNLKCDFTSSISYYRNIGSVNNPVFSLVTTDFANISKYNYIGLFPAFCDIDSDGDNDLFCGNSKGTIIFFENVNGSFEMKDDNWLDLQSENIQYSTPCFFDFNGDLKKDLVIGNSRGTILYYENVNGNLIKKSDLFGGIDVRDEELSWTGYSVPNAFINNDSIFLAVGSEEGNIYFYSNIEDNLDGMFVCSVGCHGIWRQGYRVAPAVGYLTSSNYPDIIIGNFSGGVQYFKGMKKQNTGIDNYDESSFEIVIYPNPVDDGYINLRFPFDDNSNLVAMFYLYDIAGRQIKSLSISQGTNKIDIRNLNNGIYQYVVKSDNRSFRGKVIICK